MTEGGVFLIGNDCPDLGEWLVLERCGPAIVHGGGLLEGHTLAGRRLMGRNLKEVQGKLWWTQGGPILSLRTE
jgi:hypothetical protein